LNIGLFPVRRVIETLELRKFLRLGGFYGSSKTVFVDELAAHTPILLIPNEENQDRYCRELRKISDDVFFIDADNPFYLKSRIVVVNRNMLAQEVAELERVILEVHQEINLETLIMRLEKTGYTREDNVEEENEYATRGGIVDIFQEGGVPVRIELYGDKIFSLRKFDTQTQRSIERIEQIALKLALVDGKLKPLFKSIPDEYIAVTELDHTLPFKTIQLCSSGDIQFQFTAPRIYFGDFRAIIEDMGREESTFKFLVSNFLARKLRSLLGEIEIYHAPLEVGFTDLQTRITYLTENEIFGKMRRRKGAYKGPFVDDLMGFKEEDYVVHTDYGIGQYKGLSLIDFEGKRVECLEIAYAGRDKLFLPIERMNLLERFVATVDRPPRLSKLGGEVWLRTKKRIKRATERLALELLKLYAKRMQEPGFAFSQDGSEMGALDATFPYEETKDQMQAIIDVKKDMEAAKPCDRLICGDVGYGKTEIALRVSLKAALDGKQTMLLCPTTLLAFQHYNTFEKRLKPFPVNVEMVSRFRKKVELEKILTDIDKGKLDIVIGTHRLLQPDVRFKDLGLLIIDEEQRFGVAQKERIKRLKSGIDVIYLSATPIPRTLYMALTGLKNISNIHTPPLGRKDIITKVIHFDEEVLEEAIRRELERNGQVFFVHNRIQTIETIHARLSKMLPDLKLCVLHGRMREEITAKRMVEFISGEYDVLLSTAIVESGLDMPRVNTIIVDQAQKFGLADLHQLRGRVGRGELQGYAYFIVPTRTRMTEEANKRLGALVSYTSLGSGFRLALRDMEIRGVGNLLGKEQSGHINSIGYHHFVRLLNESVNTLQGKFVSHEPILDLKLDAYFPGEYVPSAYERTALYKRLLEIESSHELKSIKDEIIDRFGRYPEQVENLFTLSLTRLKARELGASEVVRKGNEFLFYRDGKVIQTID
jgi:transcription-repair coupling factor (superfamily II helicase)